MKLLKSLILVVAAGLVMTACGGGASSDNPTDVVKTYMDAQMGPDFATMKKCVAKDLIPTIDAQIEAYEAMTPEQKQQAEEYKKMTEQIKFEYEEAKISEDGNSATVTMKVDFMGQSMDNNISLIKEDGSWKISSLM